MDELQQEKIKKRKNFFIIAAIILLFGIPNIAAVWFVYSGTKPSDKTFNRGTLVKPQIRLD